MSDLQKVKDILSFKVDDYQTRLELMDNHDINSFVVDGETISIKDKIMPPNKTESDLYQDGWYDYSFIINYNDKFFRVDLMYNSWSETNYLYAIEDMTEVSLQTNVQTIVKMEWK